MLIQIKNVRFCSGSGGFPKSQSQPAVSRLVVDDLLWVIDRINGTLLTGTKAAQAPRQPQENINPKLLLLPSSASLFMTEMAWKPKILSL